MKRGFCGIGIINTKKSVNIGTLWRSAYNFDSDFIFTIGKRYRVQRSDTPKTVKHIPLFHYDNFENFAKSIPINSTLIGVELTDNAHSLKNFCHPERAIYLLGAEDWGIPEEVLKKCNIVVKINNTKSCLNVASTGSIILYDRDNKRKLS